MKNWDVNISTLLGKTFTSVRVEEDGCALVLDTSTERFKFYHSQNCCERVDIESIVGDLEDLVGSPLLLAEEVSYENTNPPGVEVPQYQDSFTWTFYKFATIKGYVDVRWYGESNGYYSERVDLAQVY